MHKAPSYVDRVNSVTNYVAENLDKNHSVEQLAGLAYLSKYHFHRVYKALTGETIAGMVGRLRLEAAAASLLYKPDESITRLALDQGYSSGANFTKAFSRHFGCSPVEYRSNSKIGKAIAKEIPEACPIELEVELVHQQAIELAYLRRKGKHLHAEIGAMHSEVQQWVENRDCGARDYASIGIARFDSYITDEDNWIYDACLAVLPDTRSDGVIGIQRLPGGLVAQVEIELAENDSHDLSRYWDWFVRDWFLASGYELRSCPSYEVYVAAMDSFKVRLCLPLESIRRSN